MNNDSTLSYDQRPLTLAQIKTAKLKCFILPVAFSLFFAISSLLLCAIKPIDFILPIFMPFIFLFLITVGMAAFLLYELDKCLTLEDSAYPELIELCQEHSELNEYRKTVIALGRPLMRSEFFQMKDWPRRKKFILLKQKNNKARNSFYSE